MLHRYLDIGKDRYKELEEHCSKVNKTSTSILDYELPTLQSAVDILNNQYLDEHKDDEQFSKLIRILQTKINFIEMKAKDIRNSANSLKQ